MNILSIPYLTISHWTEMMPVEIPQYISHHMDDWQFEDTIRDYEEPAVYVQRWLLSDALRDQVKTNYSPVVMKILNCNGVEVYSNVMTNRQQDADNPGTYIRQSDLDLATYPPGNYYRTMSIGSGPKVMVSEPFKIVDKAPNTLLLEFSHPVKFGGIYFQSPYIPTLRVPGVLKYFDTQSTDTIYSDDPENETLLKSTPYRVMEFRLGMATGVPPWLADKVKRIFCCQSIRIDGRYYTKQEGAKWERFEEERYPMQGWKIQVREAFNRDEKIFQNDAPIIGVAAAGLIVSTKGFGINDDSGEDYLEISSFT